MKHNKVAIFDFCETLVEIQSADAFVHFVISEADYSSKFIRVNYFKFIILLVRLRFFRILKLIIGENSLEKALILLSIRGLTQEYLEKKANRFVLKLNEIKIKSIWNIFENSLNDADTTVLICSGGYDIYLRKMFSNIDVEIVCTELAYKNGKFTGFWEGTDCLGLEKSRRLKKLMRPQEVKEITVYTDSITDLPLLELSSRGVVVGKGDCPSWAMKYEYLKWD